MSSQYVTSDCLRDALARIFGTAEHMLKIWFVLKHMGLAVGTDPVLVDTGNSTPSLKRLFSFGDAGERFFIPFSHTKRFATMEHDAARSIIQTNIRRWATSDSVVGGNPSGYLDFDERGNMIAVSCARAYPLGLGYGDDGFARSDDGTVRIPLVSFAVWYGRQTPIPENEAAGSFLVAQLLDELHISDAERRVIFTDDDLAVRVSTRRLRDEDVYRACVGFIDGRPSPAVVVTEDYSIYNRKVRSMVPDIDKPVWLRSDPADDVATLLANGEVAILLFGPPRTGKTRSIDEQVPRDDPRRATIQIHDGWTYDQLIQGFVPDEAGNWDWASGAITSALADGKTFLVLEEINRTDFTQALGEVFSLLERAYRGEKNAVTLRDGTDFFIEENVVIVMTMNTVDKSTEEVDDALFGRIAAVEFPPDPQELEAMLEANGVPPDVRTGLVEVFAAILEEYPLGHGYFAGLEGDVDSGDIRVYYKTRVRPVLMNHFGELGAGELLAIDNLVDRTFS